MAVRTALDEVNAAGAFQRTDAGYRTMIRPGDGNANVLPPEKGRYHLYISYACPWCSRCMALYFMKGLEDVIGLSVVHPTWARSRPGKDEHAGWQFKAPTDDPVTSLSGHGSFDCEGCIPDTLNGCKFVRDLYEMSKDTIGKYTVPVLWDKKTKQIVNNESTDIIEMFNSSFNEFAKHPTIDLLPKELVPKMKELNEWTYPSINNGVYRCGFAKSQAAYETAFNDLFGALDKVEELLSKSRYLCGNTFTAADVRLWQTLIRFDEVYFVHFKCNKMLIREYPNLFNYTKDIYQMPGMAQSVNMKHVKTHYYTSHTLLNTSAIIPIGKHVDFSAPHDRHRFSS